MELDVCFFHVFWGVSFVFYFCYLLLLLLTVEDRTAPCFFLVGT